MKRTANIMNVKFNTLFYTALFSGLGVFSFLLLINYAAFPDKVADIFHSVGTLAFFVLAFNVLGYATMRLSTWVDNQYALNLHRRWKLISVYVVVMGMFFLLNYGLLVTAKLLAGASHPFMFPNGGWRILITVWLVELVILGLLLANRSIRNALKLQQEAAALQKENNTTLCSGGLEWHTPEWRDMPTQYHIVQGLASLPVLRVIGAAAAQTKHYNDVYDQRIVR